MLAVKLRKFFYRDYFASRFRIRNRLGCRWLLNYRNYVDRKLILKEPFEAEQLAFFSERLAAYQCDVFLDVGANFGLYTVFLLRRCPAVRRVYSIEPQVRNLHQLAANLLLNGLSHQVEVFPVGASSRKGTVEFLENAEKSTGTSRIAATAPASTKMHKFNPVNIQVDRLDDVIPTLTGQRLAIKVDVEGHELEALKGARRILEQNRCFVQVEILANREQVFSYLVNELNYQFITNIESDYYFKNDDFGLSK